MTKIVLSFLTLVFTLQLSAQNINTLRKELGITVSYWRDLESIKKWKENTDHAVAQVKARKDWYQSYKTRIALVERDYGFEK